MMLTLIQKLAHLCLKPLIALFDFPVVPAELTTLVNKLFEYIQAGTGILNFFVPFDVIRPAIDVFLAVWAIEHGQGLFGRARLLCRLFGCGRFWRLHRFGGLLRVWRGLGGLL